MNDSFHLEYEVESIHRAIPRMKRFVTSLTEEQRTEPLDASRTPQGNELGAWTTAQLSIQYPHPSGRDDLGQVKLRISRHAPDTKFRSPSMRMVGFDGLRKVFGKDGEQSPTRLASSNSKANGSRLDEVWLLDVTKTKLDKIVSELHSGGFFDRQQRPLGDTLLTVRRGLSKTSKRWTSEPALENLIGVVYHEGELVQFINYREKTEQEVRNTDA